MKTRRGSILILVLFVLSAVSLIAISLAYRAALDSRAASTLAVMTALRADAASAANLAIDRLARDSNDFDHPAEPWRQPFDFVGQSDPAIAVSCSIIDEEGKLHVSFASSVALERLGMPRSQVAALLDWIDSDSDARPQGAEDSFYLSRVPPMRPRNASLGLLDELLLIRDFFPADYVGEDANHNGILDPAEDDGPANWPHDDADNALRRGWIDLLTCHGDGKLNLNTAPEPVLAALPISSAAARQIADFRRFDDLSNVPIDKHVLRSSDDIDRLQGLADSDKHVLQQIASFRSNHFRVFVHARHLHSQLHVHLQVLVRKTGRSVEVLQWS